jgi:hypothetical protein
MDPLTSIGHLPLAWPAFGFGDLFDEGPDWHTHERPCQKASAEQPAMDLPVKSQVVSYQRGCTKPALKGPGWAG